MPGDYLRLRNVMLEYRLPGRLVQKIVLGDRQLGGISLKFQAQNLFVWADKRMKGYDPETINYTTTAYGSLPLPRSFTLGLNVKLLITQKNMKKRLLYMAGRIGRDFFRQL